MFHVSNTFFPFLIQPLGSNVAVGLFTYMYSRKESQLVFVAAIHLGSLISDVISLCLHGSDWSGAGHEVAFGMR